MIITPKKSLLKLDLPAEGIRPIDPAPQRRRRGPRQPAYTETPVILEEKTVCIRYIIDKKRTVERKSWLSRQDPQSKCTHFYGRLFVNADRELYFVDFDGGGGTKIISWLVNKHEQRLYVQEDAYQKALSNPILGGHKFYQRCDGAWSLKDLQL